MTNVSLPIDLSVAAGSQRQLSMSAGQDSVRSMLSRPWTTASSVIQPVAARQKNKYLYRQEEEEIQLLLLCLSSQSP